MLMMQKMRPRHALTLVWCRWWASVSILAASFAAPPAMAAEIAGITVPETEAVQGTQLALRACAVREVFWTNLYVVSLYLPQQPGSGSVRFSDSQRPRLIRVDVTYDGAVPDGLPSSWNDQLQQRVSAEFLQTFRSLYDGLRGGDVVRLAYSPQSGTALSVNGREVVTQPGDTLFNAVAQIWIGQNPVSPNIRRLLLNQVC